MTGIVGIGKNELILGLAAIAGFTALSSTVIITSNNNEKEVLGKRTKELDEKIAKLLKKQGEIEEESKRLKEEKKEILDLKQQMEAVARDLGSADKDLGSIITAIFNMNSDIRGIKTCMEHTDKTLRNIEKKESKIYVNNCNTNSHSEIR